MNKENLQKYIQSLIPIAKDKTLKVTENFVYFECGKNEILLKENKVSKETFFLESGFMRSYTYSSNGDEVTTNIYSAPCFVNDFLSFFKQQPTHQNFQTLTNCVIWKMSYQDVQTSFHNIAEFREFGRMMLVTNYSVLQARMLAMIKDTAENRYQNLMQQQPEIFQNIPLKIIASYLGITNTSLSRIRKEITQK